VKTIMDNEFISAGYKAGLLAAGQVGHDGPGSCSRYTCTQDAVTGRLAVKDAALSAKDSVLLNSVGGGGITNIVRGAVVARAPVSPPDLPSNNGAVRSGHSSNSSTGNSPKDLIIAKLNL
jgi:hypothetical protein